MNERIGQLWARSLDGALADDEWAELEEALARDPTLAGRMLRDLMVDGALSQVASERRDFTQAFRQRLLDRRHQGNFTAAVRFQLQRRQSARLRSARRRGSRGWLRQPAVLLAALMLGT
jgi:anti-sigma factor RsiW